MGTERTEDFIAAQERLLATHDVDATSRFLDLPWRGLRAHVLEVAGEKPPLVFVHGGGAFGALWAPLLARLANHTRFAVDRPGFGLTERVTHRPETLREDAVGFLEGTLDTLEIERATIVANSIGALWTIWLALDRPDRVERLVLIGCPAMLLDTSAPLPLRLLGVPLVGRVMMAIMPPSPKEVRMVFDGMNEGETLEKDPALAEAWLASERRSDFGPAWRDNIRSLLTPLGPRKTATITPGQLRRIQQPVQVIWGRNDPLGSVETGKRAANLLPNADFAVIPGGHLPWLDSPDMTAGIIQNFVEKTNPGHCERT